MVVVVVSCVSYGIDYVNQFVCTQNGAPAIFNGTYYGLGREICIRDGLDVWTTPKKVIFLR